MQPHRLLVDTHHRFPRRERLLLYGQHILHAGDVFLIEFGHAPHFFPATVSGRGFRAGCGPSLVPLGAPVCALPPRPPAGAPSSAPGLPAADCRPGPRCAAAVGHPTALLSPAAPAPTRPLPARLADSVGGSAIPSSGSTQRCGLPCESLAHPPVAAAPRPVAPFVPAADRRPTIHPIAAAPAWTTGSEPSYPLPCPSNTPRPVRRQVSTCITIHVVAALGDSAAVVEKRTFNVVPGPVARSSFPS